jgi:hypothetical protein
MELSGTPASSEFGKMESQIGLYTVRQLQVVDQFGHIGVQ